MRTSLRITAALAGVGLGAGALAPRVAGAYISVEPSPPPVAPARNSPRCPPRKPAFGATCTPAQRDLRCSYTVRTQRYTYVCAEGRPGQRPWWRLEGSTPRSMPMPGPLPPPELAT